MIPMHLSAMFLADLQAVDPAPPSQVLPSHFLEDLTAVFATLDVAPTLSISDDELGDLEGRLQEWRSETVREVERLIQLLQADDPLLCPISLFRTMDYGRLETAHTRALAWLLNPVGEHGFGSKLLEALLSRVANHPFSVEAHLVTSEHFVHYAGKTIGRIDVFAEGNWIDPSGRIPWRLVVEAKINASEGEEQLARYDEWLDKIEEQCETFKIFLTPDGRSPDTSEKDWKPLRFQELAKTFRIALNDLRDKPGYHYLRFYLAGLLHDVCGLPLPVRSDSDDPYCVLTYLKHITQSLVR